MVKWMSPDTSAAFTFENVVDLADWVIQRLFKDIDSQDLAISLKASDEATKMRIYKKLSKRAVKDSALPDPCANIDNGSRPFYRVKAL